MLFHNIFEVERSAVLVVNFPGKFMRFPPTVIRNLLGSSFLWAIIYDNTGIGNGAIAWNAFYFIVRHKYYCVGAFCAVETLC